MGEQQRSSKMVAILGTRKNPCSTSMRSGCRSEKPMGRQRGDDGSRTRLGHVRMSHEATQNDAPSAGIVRIPA